MLSNIQEYLIKHRDDLLRQNPVEILETFYQHEPFTDLYNCCLEKICNDPKMIFDSDKFISLKAPLLELLLKRDNFDLDEITIWDRLIKWGLAQHITIPQDVTKWNKEEIIVMKGTFQKLVLLENYCRRI